LLRRGVIHGRAFSYLFPPYDYIARMSDDLYYALVGSGIASPLLGVNDRFPINAIDPLEWVFINPN
jgi:hypothetical protein